MSVENKIQAAASQNDQLLKTLSETDHALPSLQQHNIYISNLEHEFERLDAEVKNLEAKRDKEFKEHEAYRDSVMKRFAYKVSMQSTKFEAKASKEEREYFDALQNEHNADKSRNDIEHRLNSAKTTRTNLESVVARHTQAQQELDALYDSIFDGPSPGFPDEDQRERAAAAALQRYQDLRAKAASEGQAIVILADAQTKMKRAIECMQKAMNCSRADLFGGGTLADMMERSALSDAQVQISQCQVLVSQAQRMSGSVASLPPIGIAHGNLMSDVFFDNIFTDMSFHKKIKQSMVEVQEAASALDGQEGAAKQRYEGLSAEIEQVGRALEESRMALQQSRELAFQRVVRGHMRM